MIPIPDASTKEASFLGASLTLDHAFQTLDQVRSWLSARPAAAACRVREIPLDQVRGWRFHRESGGSGGPES